MYKGDAICAMQCSPRKPQDCLFWIEIEVMRNTKTSISDLVFSGSGRRACKKIGKARGRQR